MEFTEEEKDQILSFGALSYKPEQIAKLWGKSREDAALLFDDPIFLVLYEKGKAMAQFVIDKKLFDMARSGDLKALEKYELLKLRNEG